MVWLTVTCARHPWATLALALALTGAAGWSAFHTATAVGTDANLGADHPAVRQFDEFLDRFGGGYPIVVAYECSEPTVCGGVFDRAALEMASTVSQQLLQTSFVARVSSPATTRLLVPSDFGLEARQFVVDGVVAEDPDLIRLALADPLWSRTLVSADGRVGAIVVELSSTDSIALSTVMGSVRESIAPFETRGFTFHVVGEAAIFVAAQEAGLDSAARAGVFTGGMLSLVLLLLLRSLPAVVGSLATIGVASAWTIGLLPFLGWQQSELTNGAATLILVIGCADCVHFVTHYLEIRPRFSESVEALEATSRWVVAPCFLTSATTAGAFVSFATGGVLAVTQFGVMAAIGVLLVFLLTFSLFPALLILVPPSARHLQYSVAWQEVLARLTGLGVQRRHLVLGLSLGLAVLGGVGIPKLRVEMDIAGLWGQDHPVTRAIDFVSAHLQRADRLEIEVTLPPEAQLEDPGILRILAALEDDLVRLDWIGHPQSLVTVLRHLHHILSGVDPEERALPDSEAAIGELLFLASAGASGVLDPWLTLDQRHTRLSLEVDELPMRDRARLLAAVDGLLRARLPQGWGFGITGPVALTTRYGVEFSQSQTNIVSASSLLVVAMIGLYLRSLPWALLAVIPNAVALVLLFGAMGHWGIPLNFGSAIVAPIAIGIAADDTIHFLTAYSRERRSGQTPIPALHRAISGVGEAVIATAVALSLGFLSMMTSPMATVADMGLLCSIAILGATAADLLILPALIATVAGWRSFERLPEHHG